MPNSRVGYEDTLKFTTSLCLSYILLTAILRAWVRRSLYGLDDYIIVGATVVSLAQYATGYVAISAGGGKPWSYVHGDSVGTLSNASVAGIVTFVLAHYLSKASVIAFLLRLTKDPKQILLYRINIAVCAAAGLASVLLVTVGLSQSSGYYWDFAANTRGCSITTTRWDAFTALDCITEVVLLVLPVYQVWGLQMPRSRKIVVISAFWLRLPVIGLSIGRSVYTNRLCRKGIDPGLDSTLVMIWMQVELTYGIIATTFCVVRAFTMAFNSNLGMGFVTQAGPEAYSLSKLGKSGAARSKNGSATASQGANGRLAPSKGSRGSLELVPKQAKNFTRVSTQAQHRAYSENNKWGEGRSSSSERGVEDGAILRETEYTTQYHYADELPILSDVEKRVRQAYA